MLPLPCACITRISCFHAEQHTEHVGIGKWPRSFRRFCSVTGPGLALGAGVVDGHIESAETVPRSCRSSCGLPPFVANVRAE